MNTRKATQALLIITILAAYSCSTPYSISAGNPKMLSAWTVTSIQTDGEIAGLDIPAPVFDDATINCLSTSNWSLSDGGTGTYYIKGADVACTAGVRKISWQIINLSKTAHYFQFFRFMAPKGILADRFTTYIMQIAYLGKTTMVLKYPVKYHDKIGSLVFTFAKGKG